MKKVIVFLSIIFMFLFYSKVEVDKRNNLDLNQLVRADVHIASSNRDIIISNKDTIDSLRKIFEQIQWGNYTDAIASEAKNEDIQITLFLETNKNMPEPLIYYSIWFNHENELGYIIKTTNNSTDFSALLDKENIKVLKSVLNMK